MEDENRNADSVFTEDQILYEATRRINGKILGAVFGILGGLVLFFATIILVVKGGETVGPHLGLLGQFLPGYSVTVGGSFLGLLYGIILGFVVGWGLGWIYNGIVNVRVRNR